MSRLEKPEPTTIKHGDIRKHDVVVAVNEHDCRVFATGDATLNNHGYVIAAFSKAPELHPQRLGDLIYRIAMGQLPDF